MTAPPVVSHRKREMIANLRDGGAQARIEINVATVAYSDGTYLWLANGYHRVRAAEEIGRAEDQD